MKADPIGISDQARGGRSWFQGEGVKSKAHIYSKKQSFKRSKQFIGCSPAAACVFFVLIVQP